MCGRLGVSPFTVQRMLQATLAFVNLVQAEQRHAAILGLGILCRFDFVARLLLSGLNMCLPWNEVHVIDPLKDQWDPQP